MKRELKSYTKSELNKKIDDVHTHIINNIECRISWFRKISHLFKV